jgi:membrane fusion protein (multidrug efflux system)
MSTVYEDLDTTKTNTVAEPDSYSSELPPPARKNRALIAAGAVALLLVLGFGVRYILWSLGHETTDDAYVSGHLHPISARVTDTVQQVLIDDNQNVVEGQTLVILDPKDFQVHLDQARAALDVAMKQAETAQAAIQSVSLSATAQATQAKGAIGEAEASISASQAEVVAAQAGVPRAQAQLQQANATVQREEQDLHRYEDLVAKEQVSRQTLDHARANYQIALAAQSVANEQVRQAEAHLVQAKQGVVKTQALLITSQGGLQSAQATRLDTRVREGQYAAANAAVAQATAALAEAELQLSYTVIKAPVSGRIGRKSVEVGQRVQVGQPLMAIVEDKLWVVANFKETQLTKIRAKEKVELHIDSFPGHKFYGTVDSIAPGSGNEFALLPSDNATGNFTKIVQRVPVKIVMDPQSVRGYEGLLSPGISVVVSVETR